MRILIVTQTVDQNDPMLGFFCRWIEEFAKHFERIEVICLREGKHNLPQNVRVHSLGKERIDSASTQRGGIGMIYHTFLRVRYIFRFLRLIWRLRMDYDAVFVHMNPEYVMLGGIFWRVFGKRIGLWYVHKHAGFMLRTALLFVHVVFTASPESFRLRSHKIKVMGHGIDVEHIPKAQTHNAPRLVTLGRVTPIKHIELQIRALALLPTEWSLSVIGGPAQPEDEGYLSLLKEEVHSLGISNRVFFRGPLPQSRALEKLTEASVFLHTSETGSLDKALLEGLAVGLRVVSTSTVLSEVPYIVRAGATPKALRVAILSPAAGFAPERQREYVIEHHSLPALIERLAQHY